MQNIQSDLPSRAEVVIIGGGVIGNVIAYFLAREGIHPVLIERRDIAAGTSSKAAAAALLQTKTSAGKLALANRSLTLLDKLHEELEGCFEYAHTGSLLAAANQDEWTMIQGMNATLQSLGLRVELLDAKQSRELMPVLGPAVLGGSFSPRDAQISPLELVVACASAAREKGAVLKTFTEVRGIETDGEKILGVQTTAGRIKTDTIINAAGIWATSVAKMVGLELPVAPLKGELLVTERRPQQMTGTLIAAKYLKSKSNLEGGRSGQPPQRSVGITLVQVAHGNFIVGSTREQAGEDRRSTYGGVYELVRQLLDLTPVLADVHLLRAYAGLRPITPDGYPIIGRAPQLPGFILASGFGGDGLAMSAISADMILSILQGKSDEEMLKPFSPERFQLSKVT